MYEFRRALVPLGYILFLSVWGISPAMAGGGQGDECRTAKLAYAGRIPTLAQLAIQAERASTNFLSPSVADLRKARTDLYRALNALKAAFREPDKWRGWASFLGWNEAVKEFEHQNDNDIDLSQFRKMQQGLFSEYVNELSLKSFSNAREALQHWIGLVSVVQLQNPQAVHQQNLTMLAEGLRAPKNLSSRRHIAMGLHWLTVSAQLQNLKAAIACHFSRNNLRIIASEEFLERVLTTDISERVRESRRIGQWSNGAYVSGISTTSGTLGIDVVSNRNFAQIDLVFSGKVESRVSATASRRGLFKTRRYTIPMSFWTNVEGRKPLLLSHVGVSTANARGTASTTSAVSNRVTSNALLGNGLALNRAQSSQPQAQQSTSMTVISEVANRLNRDAAEPMARAQTAFINDFRLPFKRKNAGPARLNYHSTDTDILVDMLVMTQNQIGAYSAIPALPRRNLDLTFVVHQSFASNFSSAFQSGETVTYKDVAVRLADVFGQVPPELDTNSPLTKPWAMTFADHGGVEFDFGQDRLLLCFNIADFEVRRQSQGAGFRACATYDFQYDADAVKFERRGEVDYQFIGHPDERASRFISKKIRAMFLEKFNWENGIALPGEWSRVGDLKLMDFGVQDGWIWFGYNIE